MQRRQFIAGLASLAALPLTTRFAMASMPDNWPARPVTLVVPFAPGGVTDVSARVVASQLEKHFKATFVVANRAGASGNIGATQVARSDPDGYTFLYSTQGIVTGNPFMFKSLEFDVQRDFAPIGLTYATPHVLAVGPKLPNIRTAQEFVQYARENPGKLTYGSSGVGGGGHLFMEYFKSQVGLDILHVPYKGSSPAMADVAGGHLDVILDSVPSCIGQIRAGNLRALAVSSAQRDPLLPDVPTIAETIAPEFDAISWGVLLAPSATPAPIVEKFSRGLHQVMSDSETLERLAALGASGIAGTPAQAIARIEEESVRWSKVIRDANISSD